MKPIPKKELKEKRPDLSITTLSPSFATSDNGRVIGSPLRLPFMDKTFDVIIDNYGPCDELSGDDRLSYFYEILRTFSGNGGVFLSSLKEKEIEGEPNDLPFLRTLADSSLQLRTNPPSSGIILPKKIQNSGNKQT